MDSLYPEGQRDQPSSNSIWRCIMVAVYCTDRYCDSSPMPCLFAISSRVSRRTVSAASITSGGQGTPLWIVQRRTPTRSRFATISMGEKLWVLVFIREVYHTRPSHQASSYTFSLSYTDSQLRQRAAYLDCTTLAYHINREICEKNLRARGLR